MIKKMNIYNILLVLLISVFLIATTLYAETSRGVSKDTIKIGVLTDITGVTASIQGPSLEGYKIFFRWVNDRGGIDGRKIDLIIEDTKYSIPQNFAAFKKFMYRDKVFAILGSGASAADIALTPLVAEEKVPRIPLSKSGQLVDPFQHYTFINAPIYEDGIRLLVDYIVKELNPKDLRLGIVLADAEAFKPGLKVAQERGKKYGVEVTGIFLSMGALDATSQVLQLKREKVNCVIIHNISTAAITVVTAGKKLGFNPNYFGSYWATQDQLIKAAKEAARNYWGVHCFSGWDEDNPGIKELRNVTKKYDSGATWKDRAYTDGWVLSMILAEGIKRAKNNLTNEGLVNAIESMKNFSTKDLSGPLTYSSTNHKPNEFFKIYKADVEKGFFVPISSWKKPLD